MATPSNQTIQQEKEPRDTPTSQPTVSHTHLEPTKNPTSFMDLATETRLQIYNDLFSLPSEQTFTHPLALTSRHLAYETTIPLHTHVPLLLSIPNRHNPSTWLFSGPKFLPSTTTTIPFTDFPTTLGKESDLFLRNFRNLKIRFERPDLCAYTFEVRIHFGAWFQKQQCPPKIDIYTDSTRLVEQDWLCWPFTVENAVCSIAWIQRFLKQFLKTQTSKNLHQPFTQASAAASQNTARTSELSRKIELMRVNRRIWHAMLQTSTFYT